MNEAVQSDVSLGSQCVPLPHDPPRPPRPPPSLSPPHLQIMTFWYPFAAQLITGPAMLITSIVLLWFQIK